LKGSATILRINLPVVIHFKVTPFSRLLNILSAIHGATFSTLSASRLKIRFARAHSSGRPSYCLMINSVMIIPGRSAPTISGVPLASWKSALLR
jgi:hypothetical protein